MTLVALLAALYTVGSAAPYVPVMTRCPTLPCAVNVSGVPEGTCLISSDVTVGGDCSFDASYARLLIVGASVQCVIDPDNPPCTLTLAAKELVELRGSASVRATTVDIRAGKSILIGENATVLVNSSVWHRLALARPPGPSGGGGHGGVGSPCNGVTQGGEAYGDGTDPNVITVGSPGLGADLRVGGPGGGLIRLHASSLDIRGLLSADGGAGAADAGGGAGGGVVLRSNSLNGSGTISARGGAGGDGSGGRGRPIAGSGGGGRLYLSLIHI